MPVSDATQRLIDAAINSRDSAERAKEDADRAQEAAAAAQRDADARVAEALTVQQGALRDAHEAIDALSVELGLLGGGA